jgi:hypothetical protein
MRFKNARRAVPRDLMPAYLQIEGALEGSPGTRTRLIADAGIVPNAWVVSAASSDPTDRRGPTGRPSAPPDVGTRGCQDLAFCA